MASASKALVRESVYYTQGNGPALAPFGEYEISRDNDGSVCFSSCATASAFRLSIDALLQHVSEGRIRLIGGQSLPPARPA